MRTAILVLSLSVGSVGWAQDEEVSTAPVMPPIRASNFAVPIGIFGGIAGGTAAGWIVGGNFFGLHGRSPRSIEYFEALFPTMAVTALSALVGGFVGGFLGAAIERADRP